MERKTKNTIKLLNRCTNHTVASSKIKIINVEEDDGMFMMRPQMHLMLKASTGSFKTALLKMIKKITSSTSVDSSTTPGMIGTIDSKTYQMIPGAAWTGRNGLLLFDEFTFRKKTDDFVVFLKLLEDQYYSRRFGLFSSHNIEKDGDLYFKVDKGMVEIKTRFSAVIATMKRFEFLKGDAIKALVNRHIPIEFHFTLDELEDIMHRTNILKNENLKVKPEYLIKRNVYNRILSFTRRSMQDRPNDCENFARTVGDLCRIYCIEGNFSHRFAKDIIQRKLSVYAKIGAYFKEK